MHKVYNDQHYATKTTSNLIIWKTSNIKKIITMIEGHTKKHRII